MLYTAEEIALLANAQEPGIRDPRRSEYGIENILADFMRGIDFSGTRILELGPGHFEFCQAVRRRGATAEAVELDPPVIELGRRRGFKSWPGNLVELPALKLPGGYDGLFCKGSNNPFWFYRREDELRRYTAELVRLVKPGGWLWVASSPYSSEPLTEAQRKEWLDFEGSVYAAHGCRAWPVPNRLIAGFYGISYEPGLVVYTKGLSTPRWSLSTPFRFAGYVQSVARRRLRRKLQRRKG